MPGQESLLEDILANQRITTLFQPIYNLGTGRLIGCEAFSRGPSEGGLESPAALLALAAREGKLYEMEAMMQQKASENAHSQHLEGLLFLNVGSCAMSDPAFWERVRRLWLLPGAFPAKRTVFELAQCEVPEHFGSFSGGLRLFGDAGAALAFDNVGVDCVRLAEQCTAHPQYLKIDRRLIRGIDKDAYRKSLLRAISTLASGSNIRLIATGVETREELKTLIGLGVYAGQGYHLGRPGNVPSGSSAWPADEIRSLAETSSRDAQIFSHIIGEICEPVKPFSEEEKCITVKNFLEEHRLEGVCTLTASGAVSGLVMKRHLDSLLSRQYGFELFAGKPVRRVVDTHCITVDYSTPIRSVAEQVYARSVEKTYDNIIVTRQNRYVGIVTFIDLLRHAMEIERSLALERNPLTGLPGNVLIGSRLDDAVRGGQETAVVYFDLNQFKAYNDAYGFERGDAVIRMAGGVIGDALAEYAGSDAFLGHVGGDDFVAIVHCGLDRCIGLCQAVAEQFDRQVPGYFDTADRRNGFLRGHDREDNPRLFSLTSISAAGVFGSLRVFSGSEQLARHISGLKGQAKRAGRSAYVLEDMQSGRQFSSLAEDGQMSF